ncbi:hypothetical protein Hanom_Chr16g01476961 [Helianthus anomalus]
MQLVRHHLDSVTSPYSQVCYETDLSYGPGPNSTFRYHTSATSAYLELSDQSNTAQLIDHRHILPRHC